MSVSAAAREELLQRLQFFSLEPQCVLDIGAGSCQGTLELARRFRDARIVAIDRSPQRLARAPRSLWRRRFERVCADACALPLAAACCDLIFGNLLLQGGERLEVLFTELRRVLRPGGLLLFSSCASGTLQELRSAWAAVDAEAHVNEFADLPQVAEALRRSGFIEPVIDVERLRRHYASVQALRHELKQLGTWNAPRVRPRGLGGRSGIEAMRRAYESLREAAGLPATWELLYGAAFAGSAGVPEAAGADGHVISLDRLRRGLPGGSARTAEN